MALLWSVGVQDCMARGWESSVGSVRVQHKGGSSMSWPQGKALMHDGYKPWVEEVCRDAHVCPCAENL